MISKKYKFLFIHYPKTGGNSIQTVLEKYADDKKYKVKSHHDLNDMFEIKSSIHPEISKHSPLRKYLSIMRSTLDDYFIFTTIRNPFDRVVSSYFTLHKKINSDNNEIIFSKDLFYEEIKSMKTLKDFSYSKKRKIDFFIKFESLQDDFNKVCENLSLPFVTLPKKNISNTYREPYQYYYDDFSKKLVEEKFKYEIEFGKYTFE